MNPFFSSYLDTLRFIAAITVLLSHFAYPRFTEGDYSIIRDLNLGSDAVVIFFVLSGFLIAHAAQTKDKTLGTYVFNRLTRLYSVAIPAIAITLGLDMIGALACPTCYVPPWYIPSPLWQQILQALTFSNEFIISPLRIGSNGPYWSLSYEALYYALFGCALFLKGKTRILTCLGLCLIAGPAILVLLPIWLGGAGLYRWIQSPSPMSQKTAWALALLPPILYATALSIHIPSALETITEQLLGMDTTHQLLRFSNEWVWNNLTGLLCLIHLAGIYILSKKISHHDTIFLRVMRWGAKRSFTLYLIHYPVLQYLDAVFPDTMPWRHAALLGGTLLICFMVASMTELHLNKIRQTLIGVWRHNTIKPHGEQRE